MLRATIALLALTVTAQAGGEVTLSCDGTETPFLKYGRPKPITTSLSVNLADASVTWEGTRARFTPGVSPDDQVLIFEWQYFMGGDDCYKSGVRSARGKCILFAFSGNLNRVTGVASILRTRIEGNSSEDTTTMNYELRCKPAKPLF